LEGRGWRKFLRESELTVDGDSAGIDLGVFNEMTPNQDRSSLALLEWASDILTDWHPVDGIRCADVDGFRNEWFVNELGGGNGGFSAREQRIARSLHRGDVPAERNALFYEARFHHIAACNGGDQLFVRPRPLVPEPGNDAIERRRNTHCG